MTGQLAFGAVMTLVASTEKLNPVALVKENLSLPPVNVIPPKRGKTGAGILNPDEVTPVRSVEVNETVAPVTAAVLNAVKPAKVAVPETAAFVVVPPIVHAPAPT